MHYFHHWLGSRRTKVLGSSVGLWKIFERGRVVVCRWEGQSFQRPFVLPWCLSCQIWREDDVQGWSCEMPIWLCQIFSTQVLRGSVGSPWRWKVLWWQCCKTSSAGKSPKEVQGGSKCNLFGQHGKFVKWWVDLKWRGILLCVWYLVSYK